MVEIKAIRASNANIKDVFPDPVAVFVSATSGIGQATMEELAKDTRRPTIYFAGRDVQKGAEITANLKKLNSNGIYHFIQLEALLMANVDRFCEEIKSKEKKIDMIVLSCGYLEFGGNPEFTKDGLAPMVALRCYARLRLIQQLLPLHPNRVISVLAATTEGPLKEDDFALRDPGSYTFMRCAHHTTTLTSLAFEHLAKKHPDISFVHMFPGMVKTPAFQRLNAFVSFLFTWILLPLLTPWCVPLQESGERTLFYLTSARYAPKEGPAGVSRPEGVDSAKGDGAYLVGSTGDEGEGKPMAEYRQRGLGATVWKHMEELFAEIENKSQ